MSSMPKTGFTVVLPTYKEFPNLEVLVPQLIAMFNKQKWPYQVLVVDDDSQDGTEDFLKKLASEGHQVTPLIRKGRRGLISALIEGTKAAKHAHIIHMDADLAHRVSDLKQLIQLYLEELGTTVVVGSRFVQGSTYSGKPKLNQLASWLGRTLSQLFFRTAVIDLSNNLRIFPKSLWLKALPQLKVEGNVWLIQELIVFQRLGAKLIELPITYHERKLGQSKLQLFKETKRFLKAWPQLIRSSYG